MKIAREINGNTVEIELTEDELYDAYNEQKTLFDKGFIQLYSKD